MATCPNCGRENIPGVDECEKCGQSLTELSEFRPTLPLAKGLVDDAIATLEPRVPVAVSPTAKVGDVLHLMVDRRIGSVLVADGDVLLGIFSERDALVRLNTEASKLKDRPISEFMTPSPTTLSPNDSIVFAVQKMALGGYRHIPILTNGKPTGMISIRDVLRYMTEKLQPA
jgi:CBS domain-containing protein